MDTNIAQGFLRLLLTKDEADRVLKLAEVKRRYIIPYEVSSMLNKPIRKQVTEEEKEAMKMCWIRFCRQYDLDQFIESGVDVPILKMWFDFVVKDYRDPLPAKEADTFK